MRWRSIVCALVIVVLTPIATAAEATGSLRLPQGARLDGELAAQARVAFADLSPMVEAGVPPSIDWAAANLTLVTATRVRWAADQVYVQDTDESRVEPFLLGMGRIVSLSCPSECKVFAFTREGGDAEWTARGVVQGELRRLPELIEYWSGYATEDRDTFYYEVPPGWANLSSGPREPRGSTPLGAANVEARGTFGILLWGATVTIESPDGRRSIATGAFQQATTGPGGVVLQRRTENRFLTMEIEDGSLSSVQGAPFTLHAQAPKLAIDGALLAPEAHGGIVIDGKRRALEGEAIRVEGKFHLSPTFPLPLGSDLLLRDGSAHPVETTLDGAASSVFVDGVRIAGDPRIPGPAATGLTIAAAVVVVLAALKLAGFLPFYTRITRENALRNDNRRAIYDRLRDTAGATIPEIMVASGLAESVVRHHLRVLERNRLIVERRDGRTIAYFRIDVPARAEAIGAQLSMRDASRRLVAQALCCAPLPLTQAELAVATGLSQRLVSYHLGKLEKKGMVFADGATPRRYRAAGPLRRIIAEGSPAGA